MLRMSMRKASTIIAFSEVLKHDIIEIFDTSEEKIQVISPLHLQMQIGSEHELQQFFIKENFSKKYILSV